jgi:uncharacterized protein (DUF362 family)
MPTPVTLERCPDYDLRNVERALRRAVDPLGGMAAILGDATRVILKPNLLIAGPVEAGHMTHPAVVEAAARVVREAGDREIVIADSPAFGGAAHVARRCGLAEVAERVGLPIWDLGHSRRVPLPAGAEWRHLLIDRRVVEPGTRLVNLGKAKVHCQMYATLAIKNLFGVVPGRRKAMWHISVDADRRRFGRMLVWLHRAVRPAVNIVDCVDAMERMGPRKGDMRRVGLLAASPDAVALDRVLIEVLGFDPAKHHALRAAEELGHGAWDLSQIEVLGERIEDVRVYGFKEAPVADLAFSLPRLLRGFIRQIFLRTFPQHETSRR